MKTEHALLLTLAAFLTTSHADDAQVLRDARAVVARTMPGKEKDALNAALDLLTARIAPSSVPVEKQRVELPPVPPVVLAEVKAQAQRQYPNDHSMQKYQTAQQLTAFDVMTHYEKEGAHGVPNDVMSRIVAKAKANRGAQYDMVVYEIQNEVSAYRAK